MNPWVKSIIGSIVVMGGAWGLYCATPAGAAEREQTRRQKQEAESRRTFKEPKKSG